jgi:hypothetical protein
MNIPERHESAVILAVCGWAGPRERLTCLGRGISRRKSLPDSGDDAQIGAERSFNWRFGRCQLARLGCRFRPEPWPAGELKILRLLCAETEQVKQIAEGGTIDRCIITALWVVNRIRIIVPAAIADLRQIPIPFNEFQN